MLWVLAFSPEVLTVLLAPWLVIWRLVLGTGSLPPAHQGSVLSSWYRPALHEREKRDWFGGLLSEWTRETTVFSATPATLLMVETPLHETVMAES